MGNTIIVWERGILQNFDCHSSDWGHPFLKWLIEFLFPMWLLAIIWLLARFSSMQYVTLFESWSLKCWFSSFSLLIHCIVIELIPWSHIYIHGSDIFSHDYWYDPNLPWYNWAGCPRSSCGWRYIWVWAHLSKLRFQPKFVNTVLQNLSQRFDNVLVEGASNQCTYDPV